MGTLARNIGNECATRHSWRDEAFHTDILSGSVHRVRPIALCIAGLTLAAAAGCGGNSKTYDIAPIFPLSSDKCAQYHGNAQGTGITAHCYVTKSECERAASDWRSAMQQSGVTDAIEFTC
jgi:hypothetical protein